MPRQGTNFEPTAKELAFAAFELNAHISRSGRSGRIGLDNASKFADVGDGNWLPVFVMEVVENVKKPRPTVDLVDDSDLNDSIARFGGVSDDRRAICGNHACAENVQSEIRNQVRPDDDNDTVKDRPKSGDL